MTTYVLRGSISDTNQSQEFRFDASSDAFAHRWAGTEHPELAVKRELFRVVTSNLSEVPAVSSAEIRAVRLASGLDRENFALQHAFKLSTLAAWERGTRIPHPAARRKLLEIRSAQTPQPALSEV